MDYAVQTKGIAREFGEVKAVDGIDLNISRGEIYGFLGPNGAGKTTLVRMLITLLLPTRGGATVAGFDVVDQANDVRLRIGAALQEAALDPKQTGRETCSGSRVGCTGCRGGTLTRASTNCRTWLTSETR